LGQGTTRCNENCEIEETEINNTKEHCSSSGGLLQLIAPEDMPLCKLSNVNRLKPENDNVIKLNKRNLPITVGTWNVQSLRQIGKSENALMEINRMKVDIMGIVETFYDGADEFVASLVTMIEKYRIIYSGS